MSEAPVKRTVSMEIRAIRNMLNESPPPPPSGTTLREWFAGLALATELMKELPVELRAREAVRLADELITALAVPRIPTQESMAAPTPADMEACDSEVGVAAEKAENSRRVTVPQGIKVRHATLAFDSLPPPPPPRPRKRPSFPAPTQYSRVSRTPADE